MNRWITAFALAGKCGAFGASGFAAFVSPRAVNALVKSDASAILPTPTPQSRKKCRRVTFTSVSCPIIPILHQQGDKLAAQFLVIVSSRFNGTRARAVHAARSV